MMVNRALCLVVTALTLLWGPTGDACSQSMNSYGTTVPNGDIAILQGSTLQIDCLLYPMNLSQHGNNASNLRFFSNNISLTPSDTTSLQILNETALRLTVTNMSVFDGMYYCKMVDDSRTTGICLNTVSVGTVPQNITNFNCVSNNWQNLTCTWSPDEINNVLTKYSLTFGLTGRASRNMAYKCPEIIRENNNYSCFWDLKTDPPYRQSYSYYTFVLTGSNKFANNSQEIRYNHFAQVRPAPPCNLHRVELTPHSALLNWTVHHGIQYFPIGLVHKIVYCSELDEGEFKWKVAYISRPTRNVTQLFNLTLPYANTRYDARVSIKTEEANNLWSDYSTIMLRTSSKLPDRAPQTDIGSFESITELETRKVFICWRQIEKYEENGENFTYEIVDAKIGGKPKLLNPSLINKAYMMFEKLPLDKVEITIKSSNSVGRSEEQAHVIIPAQKEILPEPRFFTKIEFDNGTYELSWRRVNHEDLDSYTIFWCDNNRERPYQCEGQLNWERVPANTTIKYITIPNNTNSINSNKIYQFAISANSRKSSSGMVWALCAVIPNKSVSKIRNIWINRFGSTFIEVGWKLECSDRIGSILGYNITYCPVFSLYNRSCKEEQKSIVVTRDPSEIHSNVTNLKPHTTYGIQVAVITRHGNGHPSDPLYNITSEGPPTPPINVTISELCNDEMRVSWKPPLITNGYLRYYQVNYDAGFGNMNTKKVDIDEYSEVTLKNLTGFTNYTVTVNACTVSCSNNSSPVYVRTAIGQPGQIDTLIPLNLNFSKNTKLVWKPPRISGGPINFYQVKIIKFNDYTNVTQIYNTTANEFITDSPICQDSGIASFYYYVRAINIDNVSSHGAVDFSQSNSVQIDNADSISIQYEGPWSVESFQTCFPSSGNYYWVYGIIVFFLGILLIYGLRRLWICYKNMQNIKPCLPPGLGSNMEKEPVKKNHKWTITSKHKEDKKQSRPFADAESLLDRGIITNDMLNTTMCDNSNYSENSDSTVALSFTSSNRGTSDEAKDPQGGQDSAQSETLSANSSLRWRNNGSSGSRPASAASSDPAIWNSPVTKPSDLIQDDTTQMTPYSTIGMPIEYLPTKPENNANIDAPQPKGYVSFGSFATDKLFGKPPVHQPFVSLQQPAYVSADLPINGDGRPAKTELPSGYVMNGTINPSSTVPSPVRSVNVESIEPLVNGVKLPLENYDPNYIFTEESMFAQMPNDEVDVSNKPVLLDSGYVKRNDPVIMNGIDTSCLQKMLGGNQQHSVVTPKQTNLTNIVVPLESAMVADAALSPEAYCRFGPNTNVPQAFDFQNQSDEDVDGGFLMRSADEFDYEKHSLFEEPRRSDTSVPPSHYVPLNLQNVNKL